MEQRKRPSRKTMASWIVIFTTCCLALSCQPISAAKAHDQVYVHSSVEGNKRDPPIFYSRYPVQQLFSAASSNHNSVVIIPTYGGKTSALGAAAGDDRLQQVTSTTKYRADVASIGTSSKTFHRVKITSNNGQQSSGLTKSTPKKQANFPSLLPPRTPSPTPFGGTYSSSNNKQKLGYSVTHDVQSHVGTSAISYSYSPAVVDNSPGYQGNDGIAGAAAAAVAGYENEGTIRAGQPRHRRPFVGPHHGNAFLHPRTNNGNQQRLALPSVSGTYYSYNGKPPSTNQQLANTYSADDGYNKRRKYSFGYVVDAEKHHLHQQHSAGDSHHQFSHHESSDGKRVQGVYTVKQPDGRTRIVEYFADETGFHPVVRYVRK